ncbi:16S rRNA (cytosine(967)-C(5))-methyltransferase RsmB [Janthinobacterium agaricidamnosum]|uniref:16S rRNA (cytosine(967)-C(5))-methyltransferase RsmB n=1 Tax=Janthinobacterium agaricidamnosum TaxID=55508 RepID=UPI00056FB5B5|nr:16S rRNA (cytosine(967)-C(5))-methyltransferase RsmB [Janthinobacterium agaricidamnosum]
MEKRPTLKLKVVSKPAPAPKLRPSYHPDLKPVLQPRFQPDLRADSLAFCLLGAANAVAQVRGGTALPQALAKVFVQSDASPQARGAIQDIAYRTMRQLGRSDTLIGLMTSKAPEPPMLAGLLACALSLMSAEPGQQPYEEFTVVDQAVTVATSHPDLAHAKGMVNAVLRRFLRERKELLASALQQPLAQWNYPQWWIDAARTAYPRDWQAILTAGNAAPPLTLRVNRRKTTVEAFLATLHAAGIDAARVGPSAVRLAKPVGVSLIPGFDQGHVSVQDAGAQLAAPLLDVQDGMRVLDACAAPGGKTCHILELADVALTAIDADAKRLPRIAENLQRLGLDATLKAQDAQSAAWWDGQPFDRILADVPCTASGIVRRHPDIRWLRRKGDAFQLATLSAKILDNLWQMLAPDGKLLFVTCSLWPQESEAQAAAFAVRNNATRLAAPGQLLPTGAVEQDHDGLFYALFQKNAA